MARAKVTYVYNPVTGKREWHIEYQSDPDATAVEHERNHRALVRALVGQGLASEEEIEVVRGEGKVEEKPAAPDEETARRRRARRKAQ